MVDILIGPAGQVVDVFVASQWLQVGRGLVISWQVCLFLFKPNSQFQFVVGMHLWKIFINDIAYFENLLFNLILDLAQKAQSLLELHVARLKWLLLLLEWDESDLDAVVVVLSLKFLANPFDGLEQHMLKQISVEDSETLWVDINVWVQGRSLQ